MRLGAVSVWNGNERYDEDDDDDYELDAFKPHYPFLVDRAPAFWPPPAARGLIPGPTASTTSLAIVLLKTANFIY